MSEDYSLNALLNFLDYLGRKGLMNRNTVVSRKASCNKMLSVLDESERQDLRGINLDIVAKRFSNLQGSEYAPKSLRVYKSRVSKSLDDFMRYRENPANFSVGSQTRTVYSKSPEPEVQKKSLPGLSATPENATQDTQRQTINVPIALSSSCIVQINGLPVNMSKQEATKIANVVLAMASVEE